MANEEHVELLNQGVEAWNTWRRENQDEVDLRDADLVYANLQGANLDGANLQDADLVYANLQEARLARANLQGANLPSANLQGANLDGANLQGANLDGANLQDARLARANLQGADLSGANLQEAHLFGANLQRANLYFANLQDADLRTARKVLLDATFVKGARFDARATDPWSVLRRTYTGPRLMFNLLFFVAFVIPYVVKVLFWASVNRAQTYTEAVLNDRASALGLDSEATSNVARCLAEQCDQMPVWQLVLGVDKGWSFWTLAVALVVYNVLKAGLTWLVAAMRDEEERSGYTPAWMGKQDWQGYRPLYRAHRIVSVIFWIAVAAFAYNACYWLRQPVWIPG